MSFSTITIPNNVSLIPVDTRLIPKVLYLPVVSTNAGRVLYFKDYYGTASNSTFTLSTIGRDLIDDYNSRYTFSNAFGNMGLVADGGISWRTIGLYDGSLTPAAPGNFFPTSITGLGLWLDAADTSSMTFSGSSVTQWRDKSGNSRHANANTSATYSSSSIVFTGSQYYTLANASNFLRNIYFSIFIVEKLNSAASPSFWMSDTNSGTTSGSLHVGYRSVTNATFAFWAADLEITSISGTGATRLWSFVLPSSGNRFANLNGSLIATYTNNTQLNTMVGMQIGCAFAGNFFNGTLYEIVIYTTALTTAQIQQVEGYLAWKWSLQANLPSNHPYKNAAP